MEKVVKKVLGDKVIILPDVVDNQLPSGLYMPESSIPKPNTGTIVQMGGGAYSIQTGKLIPMETNVGDKVCYGVHVGSKLPLGDIEYIIMKESLIDYVI